MKSKLTNTLVIGGAGYIGAHLVPLLSNSGRRVTVMGRREFSRFDLPEGTEYVGGNFGQHDLICKLLDTHDEVIHLAYASVPNTSFENPLQDLIQNLPPALQLFSEVANRGLKLVLVSSGGTVYGEAVNLPICENHLTKPISPYGVTKLTLEHYAHLYATTHGLKFVCVRPANAYGAGQKPFLGQGFIVTAISSMMKGIPVKIFGQSGTIRDYLYVSDLAAGIFSSLVSGRLSETYNISSGIGLSNFEVIDLIRCLMGETKLNQQIENLPSRKFDVQTNILDSTKLQIDTGWRPLIGFKEGVGLTIDWLCKMQNQN